MLMSKECFVSKILRGQVLTVFPFHMSNTMPLQILTNQRKSILA